jgi:hypothetical protein
MPSTEVPYTKPLSLPEFNHHSPQTEERKPLIPGNVTISPPVLTSPITFMDDVGPGREFWTPHPSDIQPVVATMSGVEHVTQSNIPDIAERNQSVLCGPLEKNASPDGLPDVTMAQDHGNSADEQGT